MATAFEISRALITQGADAGNMAQVLESLTTADSLPVWGAGAVGASLTPDEVVLIILGATAANPEAAAEHAGKVSELIRADGRSLGEVLTKILGAEPSEIDVLEMTVSSNGRQATIKYWRNVVSDTFSINGGLSAFSPSTIIRGSLVQALAMKLSQPTTGGWVERPSGEQI